MVGDIVGRERELGVVAAFLDDLGSGTRGMLMAGPPGIGKTVLWQAAISLAESRAYRVLSSRPVESEARLSYAALGDLLGDALDEVVDTLPSPQQRALDVALLRVESEGRRPDRRAVSVAALGAVRSLAEISPVVLAIDDVQWIDGPSAHALSFLVRHLTEEPVGLLVTLREAPGLRDLLDLERSLADRVTRAEVGPISLTSLAAIVRLGSGREISRPVLVRVHEASGGNPLFALEIVRAMQLDGIEPEPGEPLPVPEDLGALLRARIDVLPEPTREALLVASSASRPTVALTRAALPEADESALGPAEEAGIVTVRRGDVTFSHPLLASAVYQGTSSERRRAAHRRLAEVVPDAEERARHLALSSTGPDRGVASTLEEAAEHAYGRGAPGAAAELAELARRSTPFEDDDARRRRGVQTAEYRFEAGDVGAARTVVADVLSGLPSGERRAELLDLLSSFAWNDVVEILPLLEEAIAEAPDPSSVLAAAVADRAWVEIVGGDLRSASVYGRRAIKIAERVDDPGPLSLALVSTAYAEFMLGREVGDLLARAMSIEGGMSGRYAVTYLLTNAHNTLGAQLLWSGDLAGARNELESYYRDLVDRDQYMMLWEVLVYLSELETRAGNYERALGYADELLETTVEAGYEQSRELGLWTRALAEAHLGLVDLARADATAGLQLAERHGDLFHVITNRSALGFLELSLGGFENAHAALEPLAELLASRGIVEPGIYPFVPDAVEALVGIGRLDRARAVLEPFERWGAKLDRSLALATSARCRGLIAAAGGELDDALAMLDEAVELHAWVPQPFELARTLLVLGDVRRRAKQKRPARMALERALAIFDELGARIWSAKARASLARIGGRAAPPGLTETERQVAGLVAEGKTNREVAEALFVSQKTVEANLSRIYRKLGITSRRQLAGRLDLP